MLTMLVACAAVLITLAHARAQSACTYANTGHLAGVPYHLPVTYLTPGMPDWRIAVPLPPPECARGFVSGEEAVVCDVLQPPFVRILEEGTILVHRTTFPLDYATVNVTIFCVFPAFGPVRRPHRGLAPPYNLPPPPYVLPEVPTRVMPLSSKHIPKSKPVSTKEPTTESTSVSTSDSTSELTSESLPEPTPESTLESITEPSRASTSSIEATQSPNESTSSIEVTVTFDDTSLSEEEIVFGNKRRRQKSSKFWLLPHEMYDRFKQYLHGEARAQDGDQTLRTRCTYS